MNDEDGGAPRRAGTVPDALGTVLFIGEGNAPGLRRRREVRRRLLRLALENQTPGKRLGITSETPADQCARAVLAFHYARLLKHEPGTRQGSDPESLHDMRVASRRMRAALRFFAPLDARGELAPFAPPLRELGRALGRVRDLDVLIAEARTWQSALAPGDARALSPLVEHWESRRRAARAAMLLHLDSRAEARFREAIEHHLQGAQLFLLDVGNTRPVQPSLPVRLFLPAALWHAYAAVRAFEHGLDAAPIERLHALRIAGKALRYALEFFREVLGVEAEDLARRVTTLQDHLGRVNDAAVTIARCESFLARAGRNASAATRAVLADWIAERGAAIANGRATLAPPVEGVLGVDFRARLGACLAAL